MISIESLQEGKLGDTILFIDAFFSVGGWISIAYVFFVAFFHPTDAALVHINRYGEKWAEAVLLPIMVVISILGMYVTWYRYHTKHSNS